MLMYYVTFILLLITFAISLRRASEIKSSSYLSIDNGTNIKGLACLAIFFHHLTGTPRMGIAGPVYVFHYIGFILVAVFFFYAGYGLSYGLVYKKDYLSSFWRNRIIASLMIPYWVINTICILLKVLIGETHFRISKIIFSYLSFDVISGAWFVTSIIIMYIIFYCSFSLHSFSNMGKNLVFLCLVTFYVIVCVLMKLHTAYTASISAFVLGFYWSKIERLYLRLTNHRHWASFIYSGLIFAFVFISRLYVAHIGIDNTILHIVWRNIISSAFIVFIMTFNLCFEIVGPVFHFYGKISYEFYMIHIIFFGILQEADISNNMFILSSFVASTILAVIIRKLANKLRHYFARG